MDWVVVEVVLVVMVVRVIEVVLIASGVLVVEVVFMVVDLWMWSCL